MDHKRLNFFKKKKINFICFNSCVVFKKKQNFYKNNFYKCEILNFEFQNNFEHEYIFLKKFFKKTLVKF